MNKKSFSTFFICLMQIFVFCTISFNYVEIDKFKIEHNYFSANHSFVSPKHHNNHHNISDKLFHDFAFNENEEEEKESYEQDDEFLESVPHFSLILNYDVLTYFNLDQINIKFSQLNIWRPPQNLLS